MMEAQAPDECDRTARRALISACSLRVDIVVALHGEGSSQLLGIGVAAADRSIGDSWARNQQRRVQWADAQVGE